MVKKARVQVARSQKAERSLSAGRGFVMAEARAAAASKRQRRSAAAIARVKACAKGRIAAAVARLKEVEEEKKGSVPMHFYTTPEQEALLDKRHNIELRKKEAEIDARGGLQKYAATFYLSPPPRVFHVHEGCSFIQCPNGKKATPAAAVTGGGTYSFDSQFSTKITEFCKRHAGGYKVVFGSGRKWGGEYFGGGLPADLVAVCGETLTAEDPESWDLCCG
jgi:hypothetical protein